PTAAVVINPDYGGKNLIWPRGFNQLHPSPAIEHVQRKGDRSARQRIGEVVKPGRNPQTGAGPYLNGAAPGGDEADAVNHAFPSETRDTRIGVLIAEGLSARTDRKERNHNQQSQPPEFQSAVFHLFISLSSRQLLAVSLHSCF